jgi:DNA-directed RNA polymerase specialized sigma24 family protein
MLESNRSVIIEEKIVDFISNPETQTEYLNLVRVVDNRYRRMLGRFFDEGRHSAVQIIHECFKKMISGKRYWDYDNVKIEPMVVNIAKSLIGNEVRKERNYRNRIGNHLGRPRTTDDYDEETEEDVFDYNNDDKAAYNSELNIFCDREVIQIVKNKLKKDKTALAVLDKFRIFNSSQEISEALKIRISDVDNARKRIRRAGEKILSKFSKMEKRSKEEIRKEILRRE